MTPLRPHCVGFRASNCFFTFILSVSSAAKTNKVGCRKMRAGMELGKRGQKCELSYR